jgi:hypothetical protein
MIPMHRRMVHRRICFKIVWAGLVIGGVGGWFDGGDDDDHDVHQTTPS